MRVEIILKIANSPISRGSEVKSRIGTGIFLTMYSHTASTLYLSCAEIGMMGAPSAIVPNAYQSQDN